MLVANALSKQEWRVHLYADGMGIEKFKTLYSIHPLIKPFPFNTNTCPETIRNGQSGQWYKKISGLDEYDLVISDNLPEILSVRPDTILCGSFLWHRAIQGVDPIVYQKIEHALQTHQPTMIASSFFVDQTLNTITNLQTIGMIITDGTKNVFNQGKNLLISCGKTGKNENEFRSLISKILNNYDRPPFKTIWVEPRLVPSPKPLWMKAASFDKNMYQDVMAVICRPGVGTITDSLWGGARIFCTIESGNTEMKDNANRLMQYGVGELCSSLENAYDAACNYFINESTQNSHKLSLKGLSFSGAEDTVRIINDIYTSRKLRKKQENKMRKIVYIGGDSRSGGSLLARLFDGVPGIGSYPFESEYFEGRNGQLTGFSEFFEYKKIEFIEKKEIVAKIKKYSEGKLHSKARHGETEPILNYTEFIRKLLSRLDNLHIYDNYCIFNAIEDAFFEQMSKIKDLKCIVNHNSRTFIADLETYYHVFKDSYFIHTIRDPRSNYASMKNYRNLIESKRHDGNVSINFMESFISRWLISLHYAWINKTKFKDRYLVLQYETLIKHPHAVMKLLAEKIGLDFDKKMLAPTIGAMNWGGNSSFGKMSPTISTESLKKYNDILSTKEISFIETHLEKAINYMANLGQNMLIELDNLNDLNKIVSEQYVKQMKMIDIHDNEEVRKHYNNIFSEMRRIQFS
jgi:hypothetical protein